MAYLLVILGLLLAVIGVVAERYVVDRLPSEPAWRRKRWVSVLLGIALAIGCLAASYPTSETTGLIGFPFPFGAYELRNGRWVGLGGGLVSLLFIIGNIVVGYTLPFIWLAWRLRRNASLRVTANEN